jgi:hypothetical protein
MPYIEPAHRPYFDKRVGHFVIPEKGDLEYLIFKMMLRYMKTRPNKYKHLHDCVYAAQHCADEFRRRFLDKREDEALKKNGDIQA